MTERTPLRQRHILHLVHDHYYVELNNEDIQGGPRREWYWRTGRAVSKCFRCIEVR